MRELSVAEQRYQAVMAVISDGLSISQVAEKVGVSRQTLHSWLARYEEVDLEGLIDRSPVSGQPYRADFGRRPMNCSWMPNLWPGKASGCEMKWSRSTCSGATPNCSATRSRSFLSIARNGP
jgi:hypothetical protein